MPVPIDTSIRIASAEKVGYIGYVAHMTYQPTLNLSNMAYQPTLNLSNMTYQPTLNLSNMTYQPTLNLSNMTTASFQTRLED